MLRNSTKGSVQLEHTFAIIAVALAGIGGLGSLGGAFNDATAGNADGQVARGVAGSGAPVTVSAQAGWLEAGKAALRTSRESGFLRKVTDGAHEFGVAFKDELVAQAEQARAAARVEEDVASEAHAESGDVLAEIAAELEEIPGVRVYSAQDFRDAYRAGDQRLAPQELMDQFLGRAVLPTAEAAPEPWAVPVAPESKSFGAALKTGLGWYWDKTTAPHRWALKNIREAAHNLRVRFRPTNLERVDRVEALVAKGKLASAEKQAGRIRLAWMRDYGRFSILDKHLELGQFDEARRLVGTFEVDKVHSAFRLATAQAERGLLKDALATVANLPELGRRGLRSRAIGVAIDGHLARNEVTQAIEATRSIDDLTAKKTQLLRIVDSLIAKNDLEGATAAAEELVRSR